MRRLFNMISLFQLVSVSLTVYLIYQVFLTFLVTRPTATSSEQEPLDTDSFPEVSVCIEPGLDYGAVSRHGYSSAYYYRGSLDGHKFVGWNGEKGEQSSSEILNDVLSVKKGQQLVEAWYGISGLSSKVDAIISYSTPTLPQGRCILLSLPASYLVKDIQYLFISLNSTALANLATDANDSKVALSLKDPINSVKIYPDTSQMKSNSITIPIRKKNFQSVQYDLVYKTKSFSSVHVENDPLLDCERYSRNMTYNDCILEELSEQFDMELGCQAPIYAKENENVCDQVFNFTSEKDEKVKWMFREMADYYVPKNCKTPCVLRSFATQLTYKTPTDANPLLMMSFDPVVSLTRSSFSLTGQNLATEVGGSVSSGRTLLWALLSLLTASQLVRKLAKKCPKEWCYKKPTIC